MAEDMAGNMAEDSDAPESGTGAIFGVPVEVSAVLGTSMMPVSQILKLGRGAVVKLNRRVGEDVDLHANNQLIARGEIIVLQEMLGVTITKTIKRSTNSK